MGVKYVAKDSVTGDVIYLTHVGPSFHDIEIVHMEDNEMLMVQRIFGLIHQAEDHEMREWFRYKKEMIYNPHKEEKQ